MYHHLHHQMYTDKRGFTLIELLVVVAIIGLLASVVMASLNTARSKAQDSKRLSDLHSISLALELYFTTNGSYPAHAANTQVDTSLGSVLAPTFISVVPSDPTQTGSGGYRYCMSGTTYTLLTYTTDQGFWCSSSNGSGNPCSWSTTYPQCR